MTAAILLEPARAAMNWGFVAVGAVIALAGLAVLVTAIRNRGDGEDPKATAMLIGGTMATAFGIVLAGFAIAYAAAERSQ